MKRVEFDELCDLSLQCFGKAYEWRKLTRQGLLIGHDKETGYKRRTPLRPEQVKQYMIKTLEMRKKMEEEYANRSKSDGTGKSGQDATRRSEGSSK